MTRQEALNILNLKEGFTQDALKKAYREKSKKVHPDMHPEEYEKYNEKFKEINEANEILSGKRPAQTSVSYSSNRTNRQNYFDLEQYKKNKIDEIKNMVGETDNGALETILLCFEMAMVLSISKEAVNKTYQSAKTSIYHFFEDYKNDWYVMYELSDDMIPEEINYNAKFTDFCKQLERIRDRYSKKYQFQKRLDEETEKYKNYVTYNVRIASRINTLKEEALLQAKKNGYEDIELIILDIHKKIGEEFTANFEIEQKIKDIRKKIDELGEHELFIMYRNFMVDYKEGADLSIIREHITKLEEKIASIKNPTSVDKSKSTSKQSFKDAKSIRNELLSKLTNRFAEIFKNNTADPSARLELKNKLMEVILLFNDYDGGLIDIETLLQLKDYDFIGPVPIKKDEKIEIIDRFKIFNKEEINKVIDNKLSDKDIKVIKKRFNR